PVDKRTDIWAFGVIVYELLTGRQAFHGETVSDTLAAILTREPDWSALPATLPLGVRKLLARCLERDRNRRLHDIGDARVETEEALAELLGGSGTGLPAVAAPAGEHRLPAARAALFALLGAGLLAGAFLAGRTSRREAPRTAAPTTRSVIRLPEGARLA